MPIAIAMPPSDIRFKETPSRSSPAKLATTETGNAMIRMTGDRASRTERRPCADEDASLDLAVPGRLHAGVERLKDTPQGRKLAEYDEKVGQTIARIKAAGFEIVETVDFHKPGKRPHIVARKL